MRSEKNHYIPKFYTKQWCGDDQLLCQYAKYPNGVVAVRRRSPEAVGFEYNLYTVPGVPPEVSRHIEEIFLKNTDQIASDALSFLMKGHTDDIPEKIKVGWTRFLFTLLQRNPEKIRWIKKAWAGLHAEAWQSTIAILEERGDAVGAELLRNAPTEQSRLRTGVKVIQMLMDLENIGTIILNMRWRVVRLRTHKRLLTSDRPVVITALKKKEAFVALPIAPDRLFLAAYDSRVLDQIESAGDRTISALSNTSVVTQAKRYVYGQDDKQLDFVRPRIAQATQFVAGAELRKRFPPED